MNIAVCGVSAAGCLCAALLTQKGYETTLICSDVKNALTLDKKGITVIDGVKRQNYKVNIAVSPDNAVKYDICFIAVGAYNTAPAVNKMVPHMSETGVFVSLQNGIPDEEIEAIAGRERVVSCMMSWQAELRSICEAEITVDGDFVVGRLDGTVDDTVKQVCRVMNCIFPAAITDNIYGHKFTKLILNCSTTSVGALCGLSLSAVSQLPQARRISVAVAYECLRVAKAADIRLESYANRINFYRFLHGHTVIDRLRRNLSIWFAVKKFKRVTSSELSLLRENEPAEVDYLNGYIVNMAKKYSIPTPVNSRIIEMVHEAETKKRKILVENLFDETFTVI